MSTSPSIQDSGSGPPQAVKIVRQHVHDVRNHLNGLELAATLIGELAGEDEDIALTVDQIRRNLTLLEDSLKSLMRQFMAEPSSAGDSRDPAAPEG
ncbi:MAG: hypothetical protein V4726_00635 [Verrucomicrobiota bacterium]